MSRRAFALLVCFALVASVCDATDASKTHHRKGKRARAAASEIEIDGVKVTSSDKTLELKPTHTTATVYLGACVHKNLGATEGDAFVCKGPVRGRAKPTFNPPEGDGQLFLQGFMRPTGAPNDDGEVVLDDAAFSSISDAAGNICSDFAMEAAESIHAPGAKKEDRAKKTAERVSFSPDRTPGKKFSLKNVIAKLKAAKKIVTGAFSSAARWIKSKLRKAVAFAKNKLMKRNEGGLGLDPDRELVDMLFICQLSKPGDIKNVQSFFAAFSGFWPQKVEKMTAQEFTKKLGVCYWRNKDKDFAFVQRTAPKVYKSSKSRPSKKTPFIQQCDKIFTDDKVPVPERELAPGEEYLSDDVAPGMTARPKKAPMHPAVGEGDENMEWEDEQMAVNDEKLKAQGADTPQ